MKIINKISVISFSVAVLTLSLFFLISERPTVSVTENRTLATMPDFSVKDYLSGKYTADIELFYNDTVPQRESLKDLVADIKGSFGIKSSDGVKIHGNILSMEEKVEKTETTTEKITTAMTMAEYKGTTSIAATTTVTTEKEDNPLDDPNIEGEISNSILVYNNRGIMLFGGSKTNSELYAQYVNNFKSDLGDNVNVYSMVCPTPVSYYLPTKYSDMTANEKDTIDYINKHLDGVTPVDAWTVLDRHKDEKIFQNTDHHWAQLGAFYAAEEFAKTAGVPFPDINQYEKIEKDGYVGTLYGYTGDDDLKDNPEQFIYYIPKCEYTSEFFTPDLSESWDGNLVVSIDNIDPVSWYCVFIGADNVVTHVTTEVKNGRKLAVIKDSYGNALIPCLTGSFEEIYVIDVRYFDVNAVSYFKEKGITDLLFAMNTFSATGSNFEGIEQIRTQ
ncbi:MAG: hypothetical protein IJA12_05730 [Oscillospiraceae bacterium]|nr:hypothetical protein [Oscillospiraceae bacterium]